MFCMQCGNEIPDNAVICVKCGVATRNFNAKSGSEMGSGIIVAGYVFSILMPFIGGIIGIYALTKGKPGHGIGMLILSVIGFFFWAGVFSGA